MMDEQLSLFMLLFYLLFRYSFRRSCVAFVSDIRPSEVGLVPAPNEMD